MKAIVAIVLVLGAIVAFSTQRSAASPSVDVLEYKADGQLVLPPDYREWIYLSSGLGMTYGPATAVNPDRAVFFDNVFVNPASYRSFVQSGKWPQKTMFVLEVRAAGSKGSINNGGHYQTDMFAVEAEVKDSSRFPNGGWAFFGFGKGNTAKQIPASASCYSCHAQNGAADNTFVQFYPTLLPIATAKGTVNPKYLESSH